jgi:two-component system response regulator AtoC
MTNTQPLFARSENQIRIVPQHSPERLDWRHEIERLMDKIAPSDMPVLIQGETGAGKEVIARRIHENSHRSSKPFIKINCAALPSELIESELFGYEKGAFTGAVKTTPGKFALAEGGTVFLDEIGDMDFKLQGRLLQVLQDREYIPLGAREVQKVDVRIIAATHRDIKADIARVRFREDLYYRLDVINVYVPALRHRKEEILPIAEFLLDKHRLAEEPPQIPPYLAQALLDYEWPGNVRELENVVKRLIVFRDPEGILQNLQGRSQQNGDSRPKSGDFSSDESSNVVELRSDQRKPIPLGAEALDALKHTRDSEETDFILRVLDSTRWNRKKAAVLLNMEYKTLLYRMKKLGVDGQRATA